MWKEEDSRLRVDGAGEQMLAARDAAAFAPQQSYTEMAYRQQVYYQQQMLYAQQQAAAQQYLEMQAAAQQRAAQQAAGHQPASAWAPYEPPRPRWEDEETGRDIPAEPVQRPSWEVDPASYNLQ